MIKNGIWKGEPASEEAWEADIDWSIAEPDPDYVDREAYREMFDRKEEVVYGQV